MSSDYNENFEPLVVLQFSSKTPLETKEWVIKRLTANHNEDQGAGLLARYETSPESGVSLFIVTLLQNICIYYYTHIVYYVTI